MSGEMQERYILALEASLASVVKRAKPFLSSDIVDETSGTIPLMEQLRRSILIAEEISEDGQ